MLKSLIIRNDSKGLGHLGAPRYSVSKDKHYDHEGVDFVVIPGEPVFAPENGVITTKSYPYDTTTWKGLTYIGESGIEYKIFYAAPIENLIGKKLNKHQKFAVAQDITQKYEPSDMKPHIHVEMRKDGKLLNAAEHLTPTTILHRYPVAILGVTVALIALITFLYIKIK